MNGWWIMCGLLAVAVAIYDGLIIISKAIDRGNP